MTDGHDSPAAPLRLPDFRLLWCAGLAVNLALWMQTVGASWLMLTLAPSPLMVALIQTAQSGPIFLFGLPGGVLADLVNRRVLLLATYVSIGVATFVTAVSTGTGHMTPMLLLLMTAAVGTAYALQAPAMHTTLAEAVPRPLLFASLALSAVSFNVARAVGPALAGAIVAFTDTVTVFATCAVLMTVATLALLRWHYRPRESSLPPERVLVGLRSALQYTRHSPDMLVQLLRTLTFVGAASGIWALLPLIARQRLHLDADGYGLLLACLGTGAVIGAISAVRLRRYWSINTVAVVSAALYAAAVAVVAETVVLPVVWLALGFAGAGWAVVGNVNVTTLQTSIPPWVRARAMAVYLLVFNLAMAAGGALWGAVATHLGLQGALLASVVALAASAVLLQWLPARLGEVEATTPSPSPGSPEVGLTPEEEEGPIAVQVNYRIRSQDRTEFLAAMRALGRARKRDGAQFWRVYRDLGEPERYAERFVVRSWTDYLRHRDRATEADRRIEQRARELHAGPGAPEMQHMLAERMPGE